MDLLHVENSVLLHVLKTIEFEANLIKKTFNILNSFHLTKIMLLMKIDRRNITQLEQHLSLYQNKLS